MTRVLKTRTALSSTLRNELYKALDELAKETKLNKSILIDEAIELLLKKYKKNP